MEIYYAQQRKRKAPFNISFDLNKPGEKVEHWAGLGEGLAGGQNPSLFKTFILE